jgi:hypothetical protein
MMIIFSNILKFSLEIMLMFSDYKLNSITSLCFCILRNVMGRNYQAMAIRVFQLLHGTGEATSFSRLQKQGPCGIKQLHPICLSALAQPTYRPKVRLQFINQKQRLVFAVN